VSTDADRVVITAIQHDKDVSSGVARIAYDAAEFLAKTGREVWVVAPATSVDAPEHERLNGVSLLRYRIPKFHSLDPRRGWAHQAATKAVLRRHIQGRVQVVCGNAPLSYLAACELYGNHARTCYTVHSPVVREMDLAWPKVALRNRIRRIAGLYWLNRIERECLKRSNCVTALSNYTKHLMREIHGRDLVSEVAVVPGWVDLERFQIIEDRQAAKRRLDWPETVPVFFTLRRLVDRMGLDRLLRACKILREKGHNFLTVIGGDGPLRKSLEQLTTELNLEDSVRFLGHVDNAVLPVMYGACDAFVLPTSQLECFGVIAIEALACGRPILATPVAAIPEILNLVEPEWLANSAHEDAIVELLAKFLRGELPGHDPQQLRSVVKSHYDSDLVLPRLAEVMLGHSN
jgi:glycosyltransferase involved in cell wall biosynthesis